MKTKIQIVTISGNVIFEFEKENNTIKETVREAIINHVNLSYSDLSGSDLSGSDLSGSDLRGSNLRGSNLSGSDLSGSDLRGSNLRGSNLSGSDLSGSDLSHSDLRGSNLSGSNLSGSNLRGSNLSGSDLSGSNLRGILTNEITSFFHLLCPSEGSFIGWKKTGKMIVKLLITEDAKRSNATTLKCRCSKALVLGIENIDGSPANLTSIASDKDTSFVYEIGEIVEVKNFDEDRWNECSTGIHFFISRDSAVNY